MQLYNRKLSSHHRRMRLSHWLLWNQLQSQYVKSPLIIVDSKSLFVSPDCTEVPNCASVGREECSLSTPEQNCGPCLQGHVGAAGTGNNECIRKSINIVCMHTIIIILCKHIFVECSGSPDCGVLNRERCSQVENTCGSCFPRHLGENGFSNESCFGMSQQY